MRVVLLRGHEANEWDLAPWERLTDRYDVEVLVTGSNLYSLDGLALPVRRMRALRDVIDGPAAFAVGDRYFGLEAALRGADIVHAAEIGRWFGAQAAGLKGRLGFKLVLTVWETLPKRTRYGRRTRAVADLLLPATERAATTLGGGVVCPPGLDLARFTPGDGVRDRVLSVGRLVPEKGHDDVLRAWAAAGRDDLSLWIIGRGPEEVRLRALADRLGVRATFATAAHDEMPALYRRAAALVLASKPRRGWEEQFGMVLLEALACGTPVIAAASGAIPEVVGEDGTLFAPGDVAALAVALRAIDGVARPVPERLAVFSLDAAAARIDTAYRSLA